MSWKKEQRQYYVKTRLRCKSLDWVPWGSFLPSLLILLPNTKNPTQLSKVKQLISPFSSSTGLRYHCSDHRHPVSVSYVPSTFSYSNSVLPKRQWTSYFHPHSTKKKDSNRLSRPVSQLVATIFKECIYNSQISINSHNIHRSSMFRTVTPPNTYIIKEIKQMWNTHYFRN